MKKVIFCFSGTGNSLNAARIIAKEMGGATIVPVKKGTESDLAADADVVGFLCPVYEWDIPETMKDFAQKLTVNPKAYTFMVATYIAVHGRCFETMDAILREKGTCLHYGKPLRCVASQCVAYEPFPAPKLMVPYSDACARRIGKQIAAQKTNKYPRMSPITRSRYDKMMVPFLNVQHEYDKGFYTSDSCVGCGLCQKICPCKNITMTDKKPQWNHSCLGCNACVVYCPRKAILFKTPDAYEKLDNLITHRLGLPEKRTRYHHPHITAKDLISDKAQIAE
jgi:formate hydrogenlyase subunit 6/NADH:ubiquinone oxidoreductase subunit I/flavodoxin